MLHLPDDSTPYRIVGIDPGTDTLGVSVLDLDLATKEISLIDSRTLTGSSMIRGMQRIADLYGARFARLEALREALVEFFVVYQPHAIMSETPYFNPRRPQAYEALVEALNMIKQAVYQYCTSQALLRVDPASNKANLKVSGKSSDKDLVKKAVLAIAELRNPNQIDIALLDEHSIDSLAVAWYQACQIRKQLL